MAGPTVIYGGPYAHESAAIIAESEKKKPNFDKLIAGWNTITQGAVEAIDRAKNPPEPFSGNFVNNVKNADPEEPEVPAVTKYTTPDEDIIDQDFEKDIEDPEKNVTVPGVENKNSFDKSDDVLDNL